jgi:hypothetical protein
MLCSSFTTNPLTPKVMLKAQPLTLIFKTHDKSECSKSTGLLKAINS